MQFTPVNFYIPHFRYNLICYQHVREREEDTSQFIWMKGPCLQLWNVKERRNKPYDEVGLGFWNQRAIPDVSFSVGYQPTGKIQWASPEVLWTGHIQSISGGVLQNVRFLENLPHRVRKGFQQSLRIDICPGSLFSILDYEGFGRNGDISCYSVS